MKKQPYIPLDIGDWEQDTNCLSLEAEGALLKLVFKLWKAPEKGLLLISFPQMEILFRKNPSETLRIFRELTDNNIFDFEKKEENVVLVKSRRMLREARLSKIRSGSGSKGGRPPKAKGKQNKSKIKAKPKQNSDSVNEGYNSIIVKVEQPIHALQTYISSNYKNVTKLKTQLTFDECVNLLAEFKKEDIKTVLDSMENKLDLVKKYSSVNLTIRNWMKNVNNGNNTNKPNGGGNSEQKVGSTTLSEIERFKNL